MVNNEKPVSIAITGSSGEIFNIDTCHNIIDYINLNSKKVNIVGDLSINGIITNYIIEDLSYRIQQLSTISAEGLDIDIAQLSNLILDVSNIYQTVIDLSGLDISSTLNMIDASLTNIYQIIDDLSINGGSSTNVDASLITINTALIVVDSSISLLTILQNQTNNTLSELSANFYNLKNDVSGLFQNISDISNILNTSNTSNTSNKLVNYVYKNFNNEPIYYVGVSSAVVYDFSLNISPLLQNSKINVKITLNYLTSCYPNTFLKLELYYKVNNLNDMSFGHCVLGTENTSYMRNIFSINIITEPNYQTGSIINYYIKAGIYSHSASNGNVLNFNNLTDEDKPQLLFNQIGNSIVLEELI